MPARESSEKRRGCGWRQVGGIYLRGAAWPHQCGKLPLPLRKCPTCNGGIKQARGWTWIDPKPLFKKVECKLGEKCLGECMLKHPELLDRVGLLWVGVQSYPLPENFTEEAVKQGISKRIARVPHGFKLRETWVALAHPKAYRQACPMATEPDHDEHCELCEGSNIVRSPGIFWLFQPEFLEMVVTSDTKPEKLEEIQKRGMDPVIVRRMNEAGTPQLPGAQE